ncbi:histidine phosphatase family protein [uncultured Meiothermus sp.]|jgi:broad specificity phosphatase PhoE|uniref:histidine phosphatase family protein n=1 Tax=uncultured Meiothermus sp. TaxID=157471 RepID=UPI00262E4A7F|nr:histidine phosphatase family protein [uncultured Meiothermus sp.]
MSLTEVWWIRHGESDSNAGQRTANAAAPVLTELGWRQARSLARAFGQAPDRVVTSPFIRTKQTAQPLLERFPQVLQEEWPVQEFTELSHVHRNHTSAEERWPHLEQYWARCDPDYWDGEGAETFRHLLGRIDAALGRMNRLTGLTVVFGHGLFMRAMLWQMLRTERDLDEPAMRRYLHFHRSLWIPNCAIVRMICRNGRWYTAPPDVHHLDAQEVQKVSDLG